MNKGKTSVENVEDKEAVGLNPFDSEEKVKSEIDESLEENKDYTKEGSSVFDDSQLEENKSADQVPTPKSFERSKLPYIVAIKEIEKIQSF